MTKLTIVDYPIATLEQMANPSNPRWMPDDQMAALKASLAEFSLVEPLIVNQTTNQIVGGHQRVQAAISNGETSLPAVVVELSPAQETALNLALNKIRGDWDYEKLAVMLAEMDQESIAITGFTELEAQSIVDGFTIDETEIAGAGPDGVIQNIRNRTEEEVQELFGATEKVQFGMFSKAVPTDLYEKWVASLIEESDLGESPVALGAVVAKRLGIDVTASAEPQAEADLNILDGAEGEEVK